MALHSFSESATFFFFGINYLPFLEFEQFAKLTKITLYKIPANTLFVGKNLIYVPECHSTNTLASELCQKTTVAEGTTVVTDNQTKGRGQRGNTWFSEPNKNLTFSIILRPTFLKPVDQFNLTIAVSLSIHDFLSQLIQGNNVRIKWPNDILINDKKVCGMLIENSIAGATLQQSIVGIGLNVNQLNFDVDTATSMNSVSGRDFNLSDSLHLLLHCIEKRYLQLRNEKSDVLKREYLQALYRRGELHSFIDSHGSFEGVIEGISAEGRLVISSNGIIKMYTLKEISFA
jgi:BirA family biotin operon repressor/biotin-[acetyl-CoA-carboxylase] ligase